MNNIPSIKRRILASLSPRGRRGVMPLALTLLLCAATAACTDSDEPDTPDGGRTPILVTPTVATIATVTDAATTRGTAAAGNAFAFAAGDEMQIQYSLNGGNNYTFLITYTATAGTTPGTLVWSSTTPVCWEDLGDKGAQAADALFKLLTFGSGKLKNGTANNPYIPATDQSTLANYLASDCISAKKIKLSKVNESEAFGRKNHQLLATLTHQHTDVVAEVTVSATAGMNSIVVTDVTFKQSSSTVSPYKMPPASGSTAPADGSGTYRAVIYSGYMPLPTDKLLTIAYTKDGMAQTPIDVAYTLTDTPAGMPSGTDRNAWNAFFTGKRLTVAITVTDNKMSASATLAPWTERTGNVELTPDTPAKP